MCSKLNGGVRYPVLPFLTFPHGALQSPRGGSSVGPPLPAYPCPLSPIPPQIVSPDLSLRIFQKCCSLPTLLRGSGIAGASG